MTDQLSIFEAPLFFEAEPDPLELPPLPPVVPVPSEAEAWGELESEAAAERHAILDGDPALFEVERRAVTLADRFVVPPVSVLDRRAGYWQDRRRRWLSIGMQSELGRDSSSGALHGGATGVTRTRYSEQDGLSVFDPVLCELAYRWFSPEGGRVLDPFAGGSVRGIVASSLARWYTGIDLSEAQVAANRAQAHLGSDIAPEWLAGDSLQMDDLLGPAEFDLVFSCPPYADLERYSDDPADLSTMPYGEFCDVHAEIIRKATARLRRHRFAVWVISDVRDKHGTYRGLVGDTVAAFRAAGLGLYNDCVLVDPLGTAPQRAGLFFEGARKLVRVHQHLLVFLKGDPKLATTACRAKGAA